MTARHDKRSRNEKPNIQKQSLLKHATLGPEALGLKLSYTLMTTFCLPSLSVPLQFAPSLSQVQGYGTRDGWSQEVGEARRGND